MTLSTHAITAEQRAFWLDLLGDAQGSQLPRDPSTDVSVADTASHWVAFQEPLSLALGNRAGQLGVPLRTLLLTAHVAAIGYVAGSLDVLTGYSTDTEQPASTVPFRVRFDDDDAWAGLIKVVYEVEQAIAQHGRCPLAEIERAVGTNDRLFETAFGFRPRPPGCVVPRQRPDVLNTEAKTAVELAFHAEFCQAGPAGKITLGLHYRSDAFSHEQVERIGGYYRRALRQIVDDVTVRYGSTEFMGAEERRLLDSFSGPDVALPECAFPSLFDRRVSEHPQRVALTCGSDRMTYAELDTASERVAAYLHRRGIAHGVVVTTLLPRGVPWAVTVLALMKLGAIYLPQDLEYPAERIASVLRRSGCAHIVADAGVAAGLRSSLQRAVTPLQILEYEHASSEHASTAQLPASPARRPSTDDPAYIIFTSGSTGEPKGAVISHAGMLNHLLAKERDLALGPADRIAQIATQCFDISVWQLLVAWMCGATTTIYTRFDILDVRWFLRALASDGITILEVVPSYLDLILREAAARPVELPTMRFNVVTGEPLPPELTRRWLARYPTIPLMNAYGPTEASDDVTHYRIEHPVTSGRVPIGYPIINTGIHVIGPTGALRPLGSYGEICVTGAGVGLGYINDTERTAAVFRPNTLDRRSAMLYRAGDIGRWLPCGVLDCAGRSDDQVKVRGYRIELSDIDEALVRLPGVDAAVTVTREFHGHTRLVAYFVGSAAPNLIEFQRGLAGILPSYMHPESVVRVERFPLTARGKIDRKALPER